MATQIVSKGGHGVKCPPFRMFVLLTALLVLGLLPEAVLFREKGNVLRIAVLTDSLGRRQTG